LPQQMKIPPRLLHIASNLLAQRIDGRELDFVAQAVEKADFDFRFRRQFNGVEIEQMGLDGKQFCAEGRTVADIRGRIENFCSYASPGGINTVLGH